MEKLATCQCALLREQKLMGRVSDAYQAQADDFSGSEADMDMDESVLATKEADEEDEGGPVEGVPPTESNSYFDVSLLPTICMSLIFFYPHLVYCLD